MCISVYLPMYRDGEDGLGVGQHHFKMLRILLEANFGQYQRLGNILDDKHKIQKISLKFFLLYNCPSSVSEVSMLGAVGTNREYCCVVATTWWTFYKPVSLNVDVRGQYHLPSCPDTSMGAPLQNAPLPFRAVYILSSTQL